MDTFPLMRTKWSNEHIMAAVFIVLVLYLLPQWIQVPQSILSFLAVLALGLFIDVTVNVIRYKRPVCAVSAAVTAAMLQALTPNVPLWGKLIGISAALLVGKHAWGGTGKNILNPAITGLIIISLFSPVKAPFFAVSLLLIPAVIFSLPFIKVRPFAATGFISGMIIALFSNGNLNVSSFISYGVVFWGCLVLTDPVTVTSHPLVGIICGFLAGFIPLHYSMSVNALALGVLGTNIISFMTDWLISKSYRTVRFSFKKSVSIPFLREKTLFKDMTGADSKRKGNLPDISKDEMLQRIKNNNVFGFGGAAFPAWKKIRAAIESDAAQKYFIINGVECDPGLIHDKWLLRECPDEICRGIEVLRKCMRFKSVILAVKDSDGLFYPKNLRVCKVPDYYPVGAERILIKEVLGRTLTHDTIPVREGILVLNAHTVFSIYEAVCLNRKVDSRFLTVADMKRKTAQVVKVRLGTKIHDIMKTIYPQAACFFRGGGCMQALVANEEDAIDKTVNFLAVGDFPHYKESPLCTKCGLCAANCPAGLKVNTIVQLVDEGKMQKTGKLHAEKCISCGSCSFVCLAGRNLSARMKTAKEYLKNNHICKT